MQQSKVNAVVAYAVTGLMLVIALTFSVASWRNYKEVRELKRINTEYRRTLEGYKIALQGIKRHLSQVQ